MRRRDLLRTGALAAALAASGCARNAAPGGPEDLARLDAIALAGAIRAGRLSAREAVEAAGRRIERLNGRLGAFCGVDIDAALDRLADADPSAPLYGVPFAVKDLDNYPGLPFRRGTALFKYAVGDGKAPYTEELDRAGLAVLGKTQTPEFGLLPTTEPLAYAPTLNPWSVAHSAGGSSGGAAAAVAARILPAAHASDGGGSIRIPAACCGVFGLKPTRGRFPDQGSPTRAIDLTVKHPITVSVRDSALLLALGERRDGPLPPVGFVEPAPLAPLKIAMTLTGPTGAAPDPAVSEAMTRAARLLEAMGHEIVPVEATPLQTPGGGEAFNALWAQGAHGVYQLAERLLGAPPEETGALEPFTLGLARLYRETDPAVFEAGAALLRDIAAAVDDWFGTYHAWLTPVLGAPPVKLGVVSGDVDFETLVKRLGVYASYTAIHNVAGTPAMSVPAMHTGDGLPVGVQLSAGAGQEALLLRLAYALEEANPWADRAPPLA